MDRCFLGGGFFQEISHSGINPYLTMHVAENFLRAGDPRYFDLLESVAEMASPTGQWPEAIHPRTMGGCMGDGQHVWAAAEWLVAMRNLFVREEADRLILGSGIPPAWQVSGIEGSFGPAPTRFGPISVSFKTEGNYVEVHWKAQWRGAQPLIEVCLPGQPRMDCSTADGSLFIPRRAA